MLGNTTQIYAMIVGASFGFLLLVNTLPYIRAMLAFAHRLTLQHLVFPQLLYRNRYLGPWSRADFLTQSCYIAANAFCLGFKAVSLSEAGTRAAHLSLINIAPAFAGPHFSFLADILGVSLHTFRSFHRAAGILSVMLLAFHVATVMAAQAPFPLHVAKNLGAVVGASSLCALLVSSLPVLRQLSYELFLRTHQALALLSTVSIWFHLWNAPLFPRLVIYVFSATFLSMLVLQSLHILYRNKAMGMGFCRAYVACTGDAVKIRLVLSRHVKVKAGQYVGLWIPAAGFCAFQQSHPFTVVSWSEGKQKCLDFLIEPRKGITRHLLDLGKANRELRSEDEAEDYMVTRNLQPHVAWFSGPHGPSVSIGSYETVIMIACDFGIASQLPYLIQLIHGYKNRKTHNRRIHLVWYLKSGIDLTAAELLLNSALRDDAWDEGYILSISIYDAMGLKRNDDQPGRRVVYHYAAEPDFAKILAEEAGKYAYNGAKGGSQEPDKMALLVSATGVIRDEIRELMRLYSKNGVKLFELEYQQV